MSDIKHGKKSWKKDDFLITYKYITNNDKKLILKSIVTSKCSSRIKHYVDINI